MKLFIDKIKQISQKWMAIGKPHEVVKKPCRKEVKVVHAPVAEATRVTTSQVEQAIESSEGALEACTALPVTLPTPSSPEQASR